MSTQGHPPYRGDAHGAATLTVVAALAALCCGVGIVAYLSGAAPGTTEASWSPQTAFVAAVLFGPFALASMLCARAFLRRRKWAPLATLLLGLLSVVAGLVVLTLAVSSATAPTPAASSPIVRSLGQTEAQTLWLVAAFAVLYALCGALEMAAGVLGRRTAGARQGAGEALTDDTSQAA